MDSSVLFFSTCLQRHKTKRYLQNRKLMLPKPLRRPNLRLRSCINCRENTVPGRGDFNSQSPGYDTDVIFLSSTAPRTPSRISVLLSLSRPFGDLVFESCIVLLGWKIFLRSRGVPFAFSFFMLLETFYRVMLLFRSYVMHRILLKYR